MAHWARIDDNNIVDKVIVTEDDVEKARGWLSETFGGRWLQTSYNTRKGIHLNGGTPFRGNFAGKGFYYDENLDAFLPPKEFESWILDADNYYWVAPVEQPSPLGELFWNEEIKNWDKPEKYFPSWYWDDLTNRWTPPVPFPDDVSGMEWSEDLQNWVDIS